MSDTSNERSTLRRTYLQGVGVIGLAGVTGLAGCTGTTDAATGVLTTAVKDAPGDISDFESCVVTIEGFWLKEAGDAGTETTDGEDTSPTGDALEESPTVTTDGQRDENTTVTDRQPDDTTPPTEDQVTEQDEEDVDQSDEREYHEYDEPQEADLVKLQDGESKLMEDREVEVDTYAYLQLDVSGVDATLEGGDEADVGTPGEAPLQFKHEFEVREDQRTTFTADFTPVKRGQTGKYLLQPVAKGTEVTYSDLTETPTA